MEDHTIEEMGLDEKDPLGLMRDVRKREEEERVRKVSTLTKLEELTDKVKKKVEEIEEAVTDTRKSKKKIAEIAIQMCEECIEWGKSCERWERSIKSNLKEVNLLQEAREEVRKLEKKLEDQRREIQGEDEKLEEKDELENEREKSENGVTKKISHQFQHSERKGKSHSEHSERPTTGQNSRRIPTNWEYEENEREERTESREQATINGLSAVITSMALPNIHNYSGKGGFKSFREFVDRVDMKYGRLVTENELVTIFRQHLEGDAQRIFDTLPWEIRNGPYRGIIAKMSERLKGDQTLSKYDAQRKLDKLRKGEKENIIQFCCYLESLTSEAYPEASSEMLSEIRAGKLVNALPNFEHQVQLFKILDESDSYSKYENLREEAQRLEVLEKRKAIMSEERRTQCPIRPINRGLQRREIGQRYTGRSEEQRNLTNIVNKSLNPNARSFIPNQNNAREAERGRNQGINERPPIRCYTCQQEAHYSSACPQNVPGRNVGTRKVETMVLEERAGAVPYFGALWKAQADFNGVKCTVVIDTGAESTVIPRTIMEEIERNGREKLELREALETMNDAIGRPIEIVAKTEMLVKMEGTEQSMIGVFVVDSKEDYILLGQNASGIWEEWRANVREVKRVSVAKRVCVAPGEERDVVINVPNSTGKIMLWAEKKGIGSGLIEENEGRWIVRANNNTETPLVLRKDEVIGECEEPVWMNVHMSEKTPITGIDDRGAEVLNAIHRKQSEN